jgi:hypothetical protein
LDEDALASRKRKVTPAMVRDALAAGGEEPVTVPPVVE